MDQCPTCGAAYRGGDTCRRCKTDFREILSIERAAALKCSQSLSAFVAGRLDEARLRAEQARALYRCPDALVAAARVALASGDFPTAMKFWREIDRARTGRSRNRRDRDPADAATPGEPGQ